MGFAAKKGKSVQVALTTEISQDGMLFITNMLLKISILAITHIQTFQLIHLYLP